MLIEGINLDRRFKRQQYQGSSHFKEQYIDGQHRLIQCLAVRCEHVNDQAYNG